jgi:hypothetical protein
MVGVRERRGHWKVDAKCEVPSNLDYKRDCERLSEPGVDDQVSLLSTRPTDCASLNLR